jgi:signal peptidase I
MKPNQILATVSILTCFIVPSLVFYVFDLEILYNQGLSLKGCVFILKNTDTYKPKVGDTVVFTHPQYRTSILKKVSHGEEQKYQPMVGYAASSKDDINQTKTVPKGHVAVLGDHIKSYDSRYASFGFIPLKNIRGKAWRIF